MVSTPPPAGDRRPDCCHPPRHAPAPEQPGLPGPATPCACVSVWGCVRAHASPCPVTRGLCCACVQVAQRTATHCEALAKQLQEAKEEILTIGSKVRRRGCFLLPFAVYFGSTLLPVSAMPPRHDSRLACANMAAEDSSSARGEGEEPWTPQQERHHPV
jgi:hypothetical protein